MRLLMYVCVVDGFVPRLCGRPRVAMMSQNGITDVFHCAHTNSSMIANSTVLVPRPVAWPGFINTASDRVWEQDLNASLLSCMCV